MLVAVRKPRIEVSVNGIGASLRAHVPAVVGRRLMGSPSFARMVVERGFLGRPSPRVIA